MIHPAFSNTANSGFLFTTCLSGIISYLALVWLIQDLPEVPKIAVSGRSEAEPRYSYLREGKPCICQTQMVNDRIYPTTLHHDPLPFRSTKLQGQQHQNFMELLKMAMIV